MKRFFAVAMFVLVASLAQFSVMPQAEARDVYVGTSDTTGRNCYLVMDSISYGSDNRSFSCTIKMVRPSTGDVQFLYYDFWIGRDKWFYFENSQGYRGRADNRCPIESHIVQVAWT